MLARLSGGISFGGFGGVGFGEGRSGYGTLVGGGFGNGAGCNPPFLNNPFTQPTTTAARPTSPGSDMRAPTFLVRVKGKEIGRHCEVCGSGETQCVCLPFPGGCWTITMVLSRLLESMKMSVRIWMARMVQRGTLEI